MLSIDSQIWIYYLDPNAPESQAVTKWFEGDMKKDGVKIGGILNLEEIILSAIIPIEVAHTLFRSLLLKGDEIEDLLRLFISHKQIRLVEVNPLLVWEAIRKLKINAGKGIGGRDALILATMEYMQVDTIATHDKDLLRLQEYARIDPVFQPPLILARGEAFNQERYTELIKDQYGSP